MATRSPFPGMDPWLERYGGDIHHSIIQYSRDQIAAKLPRGLFAAVEQTVYLIDLMEPWDSRTARPDVGVFDYGRRIRPPADDAGGIAVAEPIHIRQLDPETIEGHIEIRELREGHPLVTAIEVFSPTNKMSPQGRKAYVAKQAAYRQAGVNLVEIDLLRGGEHLICAPAGLVPLQHRTPYKCCVWQAATDGIGFDYYPLPLRQRLPGIRIPLRPSDKGIVLDLQLPVDTAYENGLYSERIDYTKPTEPPLSVEDAAWAARVVHELQTGGRQAGPPNTEES